MPLTAAQHSRCFSHMRHIKNRVFWGYVSHMALIRELKCVYREQVPQEEMSPKLALRNANV